MPKTLSEQQQNLQQASSSRMQISLSFLAFILIGANDGAFGVLIPSILTHYQINKATISLLFLASTAGYLTEAINNGFLMSKLGTRPFLLTGLLSLGLSMSIVALMPPFPVVLGLFLFIGFGIAVIDAGLNSYIASMPRNTALLNYLHAFYGTGALLGPFIASTMLALSIGWNVVYLVWVALCAILFAGVIMAFTRSASMSQPGHGTQEAGSDNRLLWNVLRTRIVWLAALFLFFYVGAETSLGSWSYSYLTAQRHLPALFSGWIVSGYWLGLTLGRLTLARAAQDIGGQRLVQYCLLGVIGGSLLAWLSPIQIITAAALCFVGFCLGPIFPTTIALTSRLVSGRLLASAIGLLTSLSSMGAAFFPWLAGNLVQRFNLAILLPYALLLAVVMGGFWLALRRDAATT